MDVIPTVALRCYNCLSATQYNLCLLWVFDHEDEQGFDGITPVQMQTAVTAYFSSKQILLFAFTL